MGSRWRLALLEKAGAVSVRPDEIEGEDPSRPFGIDGDIYRLSQPKWARS